LNVVPQSSGSPTPEAAKPTLSLAAREQRARAPRRHGLWAKSASELHLRHYKSGRLLRRLEVVLAEQGRPLSEEMILTARAMAELAVIGDQVYAALQATFRKSEVPSPKLLDAFRGIRRDQLLHASALGVTPAAKAELAMSMGGLQRMQQERADAARERIRAKATNRKAVAR